MSFQQKLTEDVRAKIALFGDIDKRAVINVVDVEHIYEVPLEIEKEGLPNIVIEALGLEDKVHEPDISEWTRMVERLKSLNNSVKIAIVGKYVELPDAYISINEALKHAGIVNDTNINIEYVNAESLEGTSL